MHPSASLVAERRLREVLRERAELRGGRAAELAGGCASAGRHRGRGLRERAAAPQDRFGMRLISERSAAREQAGGGAPSRPPRQGRNNLIPGSARVFGCTGYVQDFSVCMCTKNPENSGLRITPKSYCNKISIHLQRQPKISLPAAAEILSALRAHNSFSESARAAGCTRYVCGRADPGIKLCPPRRAHHVPSSRCSQDAAAVTVRR